MDKCMNELRNSRFGGKVDFWQNALKGVFLGTGAAAFKPVGRVNPGVLYGRSHSYNQDPGPSVPGKVIKIKQNGENFRARFQAKKENGGKDERNR